MDPPIVSGSHPRGGGVEGKMDPGEGSCDKRCKDGAHPWIHGWTGPRAGGGGGVAVPMAGEVGEVVAGWNSAGWPTTVEVMTAAPVLRA